MLTMSAPAGIYYTLDGRDPRASDEQIEWNSLLPAGAAARYWVPTDGLWQDLWKTPDFDDSSWAETKTGIGFSSSDGELPLLVQGDIRSAMFNHNASVYVANSVRGRRPVMRGPLSTADAS